MKTGIVATLFVVAATSASADRGHAVPRGGGGRVPVGGVHAPVRGGYGGAWARHPRAGTGTGYRYGYGYGYGHGYYGHGYGYGHYYGRYPYYGHGYSPYYYGYYPYGWAFGLGLNFNVGSSAAPYYATDPGPYAAAYPAPETYVRAGAPEDERSYRSEAPEGGRTETGTLRLSVQPDDAAVYVDDAFRGPARELTTLRLPPGRHRIEITRPGFNAAVRYVELGPGVDASVQIELERR